MKRTILKRKTMRNLFIFMVFMFLAAIGVENTRADSAIVTESGSDFVLGKGGARMVLYNDNTTVVTIVGKLGSEYVAMLNSDTGGPAGLAGNLFIVDNVVPLDDPERDGIGRCSWSCDKSKIIHIEGIDLMSMRYIPKNWPYRYMQIFWFDMREKFGDKPENWAISSSCNSNLTYVFKYEEVYDDVMECVSKRTLKKMGEWRSGHLVKGIDLLDLNSMKVDQKPEDKRCPPIFVEVNRPSNSRDDGSSGDFWCVASEIWFHNIKMINGLPNNGAGTIGRYADTYAPLKTYDVKELTKNWTVSPPNERYTWWRGICGGGVSALGTYKDGIPTFAYYTMYSSACISKNNKRPQEKRFVYEWSLYGVKHTFKYDKNTNKFIDLEYSYTSNWSFHKTYHLHRDDNFRADLNNLYVSCDSILFHCRGPRVRMAASGPELLLKGRGLTGSYMRGNARYIFENIGRSEDTTIGVMQKQESKDRTLVGNYGEDDKSKSPEERAEAKKIKEADESARQVVAIFLGYPPTAYWDNKENPAPENTVLEVNYENVKTNGVETGSGVNADWAAGVAFKADIVGISFSAGYAGYYNKSVTENNGSTYSSKIALPNSIKGIKEFEAFKDKGFIFYTAREPSLIGGALLWTNAEKAKVKGLGEILPFTGGVVPPKGAPVSCGHFLLHKPNVAWTKDEKSYSVMTDGLEAKKKESNPGPNNTQDGNLFKFKTESELIDKFRIAKEENYDITKELIGLADDEHGDFVKKPDTFKDRPVKWLDNMGQTFGYCWSLGGTFEMKFQEFTNKEDVVEGGHGGYWKFKLAGLTGENQVMARSTSRTYTNKSTTNGYKFVSPPVYYDSGKVGNRYEVYFFGFNINPAAYKQWVINKKGEAKRPDFIPKYCWDRDQMFALFVPYIGKHSKHVSEIIK
jgi:hypothetical protein